MRPGHSAVHVSNNEDVEVLHLKHVLLRPSRGDVVMARCDVIIGTGSLLLLRLVTLEACRVSYWLAEVCNSTSGGGGGVESRVALGFGTHYYCTTSRR